MQKPSYALLVFADGDALTATQVADMTNVSRKKAGTDIASLKSRGLLAIKVPSLDGYSYAITPAGYAHLNRTRAVTKTSRILDAYASGQPMSAKEIRAITGIDDKRIRSVSCRLVTKGHLEREPGTARLRLTSRGAAEIAGLEVEPIVIDSETTIKSALRTRPALQMVWGAMA
jgi:predicted HTH transcriptional regulator